MSFQNQVFISYAHLDNVPLNPAQDGWITTFHNTLKAALTMQLGREAVIWRDKKLAGNDIFADEIVQQFPQTELLISILTPRYVQSEWCTREVNEFCKVAATTGGVRVDNKSRILKVIKTPVSDEKPLPDVMKNALGYPFFIYEDEKPIGLDPAFGQQYAEKLNLKVYLLAVDVAQLIGQIESLTPGNVTPEAEAPADKPGVFIADCSVDLAEGREAVASDLRGCGYPVFPQTKLTTDVEASFLGDLAANLACCKLAVQIFGSGYGTIPDGPSEMSVPALTNALAVEYSRKFGLKRIIWVPSGTQISSSRQQQFLDSLLRDPQAQFGADLITGNLEDLKAAIHAALKKIEAPPPPPIAPTEAVAEGTKQVFVLCTKDDKKKWPSLLKLIQFLNENGMQAMMPSFSGDATAARQANDEMMAACDAAIVFYGAGNEDWKDTVQAEILKSKSTRASKQAPPCFTYLAENPTPDQPSEAEDDKQFLANSKDRTVINGLTGFSKLALSSLVSAITGKARS